MFQSTPLYSHQGSNRMLSLSSAGSLQLRTHFFPSIFAPRVLILLTSPNSLPVFLLFLPLPPTPLGTHLSVRAFIHLTSWPSYLSGGLFYLLDILLFCCCGGVRQLKKAVTKPSPYPRRPYAFSLARHSMSPPLRLDHWPHLLNLPLTW